MLGGVQVTPAGHCVHDEAPAAVHWLMREWIAAMEAGREPSLAVGDETTVAHEAS